MSEKIMERANLALEEAEEVFKRLGILEEFNKYIKSSRIISIVEGAYEACELTLQEMTLKAPHEVKELAEKNFEAFRSEKESFLSDFELNFKRLSSETLTTIIDWVHDEKSVKKFMLEEMSPANEVSQTISNAKTIVDEMIMSITKQYVFSTYAGYIPEEIKEGEMSDLSKYASVNGENGHNVIVPRDVLGI